MKIRRCLEKTFTLGQCMAWLWGALLLVLLGAHFYRASDDGMVLCTGGMLLLFACSDSWKRWAVALFFLWGMMEWGASACSLAQIRMIMGMPWMRGALILSTVAIVTGLTGLMLARQARRLALERGEAYACLRAAVFIAVFLCLFFIRKFAPLDLLLLERFFPKWGGVEIFFAACYGSFVAGLLADARKSRQVRPRLWMSFACVFFAQFALGLLGVGQMLLTGKLHVPVPAFIVYGAVFRDSLNVMPFIVLASSLLLGSAWCSMLCYFGPFDSLASQGRTLKPLSPSIHKAVRWGRAAVLVSGVAVALLLKGAGMDTVTAISLAIAYAALSLFLMVTLSRRYGGMVHCTAFCPMGLIVNLLSRISPWRMRVDSSSCTGCGACEKVCRWRAITPESRAQGSVLMRCSLCRDCISACRSEVIELRFGKLSKEVSAGLFVVGLSTLHTVFLACAMV